MIIFGVTNCIYCIRIWILSQCKFVRFINVCLWSILTPKWNYGRPLFIKGKHVWNIHCTVIKLKKDIMLSWLFINECKRQNLLILKILFHDCILIRISFKRRFWNFEPSWPIITAINYTILERNMWPKLEELVCNLRSRKSGRNKNISSPWMRTQWCNLVLWLVYLGAFLNCITDFHRLRPKLAFRLLESWPIP